MTNVDTPRCKYMKHTRRGEGVKSCDRSSVVVFNYADGVGACPDHVWPVMRWCQEGEERDRRDAQGIRAVIAIPAHMWNRWKESNAE